MPRALAFIPIVPKPRNLIRLRDLLNSLNHYENGRVRVILVVDDTSTSTCNAALKESGLPGECMLNPRLGLGRGWAGGLITGLLAAYQKYTDRNNFDYVLRIDDDALAIAPFLDKIAALSAANPAIGLFGGYEFGQPLQPGQFNNFSTAFFHRSKLLRKNRDLGGWWFSAFGWRRRVRLLLRDALSHGYLCGEWCQGGASLLTAECARAIARHPATRNPKVFLECDFTEDFFFTIAAKATGRHVWYENHYDRIFSVQWKGLAHSPQVLTERGYRLIHSVKADSDTEEKNMRHTFEKNRTVANITT